MTKNLLRAINVALLACQSALFPCPSSADQILVAAASNFREAMSALAARFEAETGHEITLVFGSTGQQYSQIMNGAPFDAFFAADSARPRLLEDNGRAIAGSRFTYARGKLVLWSPEEHYVDPNGQILKTGNFRHIAIANPNLAPYGEAAREVLEALGVWQRLGTRLVRGENVGQAFLFVSSGNAELGLVAWSQLRPNDQPVAGSFWLIPQTLYQPIEQQAVLLTRRAPADAFMSFIHSNQAAGIIRGHGYEIAD